MRTGDCLFAPRPLANFLWSDPAVPIWPYESGSLLEFTGPGVPTAITAVDLDVWGQALAEAVDWVIAQAFAATGEDAERLRSLRTSLAERFAGLLAPVFADQTPDPEGLAAAREAYRLRLLTALSTAYAEGAAGAPLRRAPAPLMLVSQAAVAGPTLVEWRYSVEFAQSDRAAQDQIRFTVSSEIPQAAARATEPNRFFRALAEFAFVYPELRQDLESQDVTATATALGSFVNVVARVAAAWPDAAAVIEPSGDGMATMREFGRDGRLVIRLEGSAEGMTPRIAGYTTTEALTAAPFDYEFNDPDGGPLGAVEGRELPRRQLLSPVRHIMESRTGTFSATVVRNAQLLFPEARATAPAFVYHSGPVTFAAPARASVDAGEPVKLTEFAKAPGTLGAYLTGLFDWVFGAGAAAVGVRFSGAYERDGAAAPVFLVDGLTGAPEPAAIEEVVAKWVRETEPVRDGASLHFDLTVTSTASGAPEPLLRLRNISVALADVAGL